MVMPDPRFAKPWHGIPREEIPWFPAVNEDTCIGCGTCVTGCGRAVYRFDFARKKAVVADPFNCMVGCMTCANTCPTNAIGFPPTQVVLDLEERPTVRHAIEDELLTRREELSLPAPLPHPDRLVELEIRDIRAVGAKTLLMTLAPHRDEDCMCQFTPGQYLEVWVPNTLWMSRAYSIGNAPHPDGSIELQIRQVEGGRFSTWAFEQAKVGEVVTARGPLGAFTMRSPSDRPLVFVARGTGFAPIKALIEQQLSLMPQRPMQVFWGATSSGDFYALDVIAEWLHTNPHLRCTLVARSFDEGFSAPKGVVTATGRVSEAVAASGLDLSSHDAYVAGPRHTIVDCVAALQRRGVVLDRIFVDSYGT
jgi:CDP-4-dehydro-6-deoxyglucose reductase